MTSNSWSDPNNPDDEAEEWDEDEAAWLLGKIVLVGLTYLKADGETEDYKAQYHGEIVRVDKNEGIFVRCEGVHEGEELCLPPLLSGYDPASPGNYELHSTGEFVLNPDLTTKWRIKPPYKS